MAGRRREKQSTVLKALLAPLLPAFAGGLIADAASPPASGMIRGLVLLPVASRIVGSGTRLGTRGRD